MFSTEAIFFKYLQPVVGESTGAKLTDMEDDLYMCMYVYVIHTRKHTNYLGCLLKMQTPLSHVFKFHLVKIGPEVLIFDNT